MILCASRLMTPDEPRNKKGALLGFKGLIPPAHKKRTYSGSQQATVPLYRRWRFRDELRQRRTPTTSNFPLLLQGILV